MMDAGIMCAKLSITSFAVSDDPKIIHHVTNGMKSEWIVFIHISPQRTTDKGKVIDSYSVHF